MVIHQQPRVVVPTMQFVESTLRLQDKNKIKQVLETVKKFEQQRGKGKNLRLHRVDDSQIDDLWVIYGNQKDLRLFLQRIESTWYVLYVDTEHDKQYRRAEQMLNPVAVMPNTGHIQSLPSVGQLEEIASYLESQPRDVSLFDELDEEYLSRIGVPAELYEHIHKITDQKQLVQFRGALPDSVIERLSKLAIGEEISLPEPIKPGQSPLDHPEARQSFFIVTDDGEFEHLLQRILDATWEDWLTFLHPAQRGVAYGTFRGPVRVTGAAGTGKTVVALHRAKYLASLGKKVLLTTFTTTLSNNLCSNLDRLCRPEEKKLIRVDNVHNVARTLLEKSKQHVDVLTNDAQLEKCFRQAAQSARISLPLDALVAEWKTIIDPQGIQTWDDYRVAQRKGRTRPLRVRERKEAWKVFERVQRDLRVTGKVSYSGLCRLVREQVEEGNIASPWQAVVVDEVQDLGRQEILLLKALAGTDDDSLLVTGDSGQRIYVDGFSLTGLGIETRGRSFVLKVNYRSSLEIKQFADRILSPISDDLDGQPSRRDDTISVFLGPEPELHKVRNQREQGTEVARRIKEAIDRGDEPGSIGVFARVKNDLAPLDRALSEVGIRSVRLKDDQSPADLGSVRLGTMHSAKGLEFRTVIVIGASDRNLPHPKAIEGLEGLERTAAIERERNLLYVAVTRARDQVHIFWFGRPCPFLINSGLV